MYKYKVSVIMAIYNVEPFLREAIDSVVAQDIGIGNIQLILVDDGSPDGCGAICDEYAAQYPDNIVAIHKENGGVSSARNRGLDIVEGELVNFMDSDDKITPETFRNAWQFYQAHKFETDVVVIPMIFFEGKTGGHTLNYRFNKGTRVIDLDTEWNVCQLSVSSTFISAEPLKSLRFDENLAYAEDAHLLQRVLASKCTMGVMKGQGNYMYRQRTSGTESALQSSTSKKSWYLNYFKYFQEATVKYFLDLYGMVPKFIQYVLMYDIQWRLRLEKIPEGVLSEEDEQEFYSRLFGMLKHFDDEVILAQRNLFSEHKIFALRMKYENHSVQARGNDFALICGHNVAAKLSRCPCHLEFLNITAEGFTLEGRIAVYDGLQSDLSVCVQVDGTLIPCQMTGHEISAYSLGRPMLHMYSFTVFVPLSGERQAAQLTLWLKKDNVSIRVKKFISGSFFPVSSQTFRNSYVYQAGWKVHLSGSSLIFTRIGKKELFRSELRFLKELWRRNKEGERKAVIARLCHHILMPFKRKPLWLISDRAASAGDNGEAFFRYVRKNHPEIDARFVISKNSSDYARMKQIGPVLAKDSYIHKIYHLLSDFLISSHAEADVYNPFIGYSEPYRDYLANSRFVFLQHGITQNDLSGWLDRYKKNIRGFVVAAQPEMESILRYPYHYPESCIWLTGFARFDRLFDAQERQITIMPTWRKYLFGTLSRNTKVWSLGNSFHQSEYLDFYNHLINHPRLLDAAKRMNYRIVFLPHPNLQDYLDAFQHNEQVTFLGKETAYRDIYAKSALVVTDYSSAVFDFAYLRKPVIYTQFDKQEFFSGSHTVREGYFDYERDGFGEVTYSLEDTVDVLIEYMENSCQMKEEYRNRADAFFAFSDTDNCRRIFEKIEELNRAN